jgi:type IV pilus assembly protein PilW
MPRPARGFTLIELTIAVAISLIVLAGIVAVVLSQQQAYADGHRQREAQGSARAALSFVEESLLLAGYGMDAPLALDFDRYVAGPPLCPTDLDPCPRDGGDADEIVFYNRNPRYWVPMDYAAAPQGNAWRVLSISEAEVRIRARKGDTFPENQILQAVCRAGSGFAYFTVAANTSAANDMDLPIPLKPSATTDPFLRQDATTAACFGGGEARLYLIDRHRFHIRPVGAESFLVHDLGTDRNLDGTIDEADELVLAAGIETIQFAYILTNPTLAPRGTTADETIAMAPGAGTKSANGISTLQFPTATGVDPASGSVYAPTSFYPHSVGPPTPEVRLTDHQANIRAIRVALRARSTLPDTRTTGASGFELPLFNLNSVPSWVDTNDQYGRVTFVTTVPLRNMIVRGMVDF